MRLLRPYNPLVYPGGWARPGFDPSHPAAKNCRLSAIAAGSNYTNMLSGGSSSIGPTPPFPSIDGALGPCLTYNGSNSSFGGEFTGQFSGIDLSATVAAVIRPASFAAQNAIFSSTASGFVGYALVIDGTTGVLNFFCGSADLRSTFALTAGVPYFVAASAVSGKGSLIALNLQTGAIQTTSLATAFTASAGNGIFQVGAWHPNGDSFNGSIADVMYAGTLLSLPQLLAWAADPWSFWYPPRRIPIMFSGLKHPSAARRAHNMGLVMG